MATLRESFTKCPSCGKRFGVVFDGKKLKDSKHAEFQQRQYLGSSMTFGVPSAAPATNPQVVAENIPVSVTVMTYEYAFHCKRCEHRWSVVRSKEVNASDGLTRGTPL